MRKRRAVVIRHMAPSRPVAHAIIEAPDDVDDHEHYFESEKENIKRRFCDQFVEFSNAEWHWNEV